MDNDMHPATLMKAATPFQFKLLHQIVAERQRQDAKWGEQNHGDLKWMTILTEEVGEAAKGILQEELAGLPGEPNGNLEEELVQIASVAMAWLEAIARRKA